MNRMQTIRGARSKVPPCRCTAYHFPHKPLSGACKHGDMPYQLRQTLPPAPPKSTRAPSLLGTIGRRKSKNAGLRGPRLRQRHWRGKSKYLTGQTAQTMRALTAPAPHRMATVPNPLGRADAGPRALAPAGMARRRRHPRRFRIGTCSQMCGPSRGGMLG